MTTSGDLAEQLAAESARLDVELKEIDLLVNQARIEAGRHESRRSAAADRLAGLGPNATAREAIDLATQTVTHTKRAALMETQLEILEGKRKSILRLKEVIDDHATRVLDLDDIGERSSESSAGGGAGSSDELDEDAPVGSTGSGATRRRRRGKADPDTGNGAGAEAADGTPGVSRLVIGAQEDLRREIARQMHDGPAQSLTNIVLQAEIVERLVGKDPAAAEREVQQLVAMVQSTLEATKTFIFDVRPMVLDDLGLVPTLRRAARDRGRRAGLPVEFESVGLDRRLEPALESGVFRILDEILGGFLAAGPDAVSMRLDWADDLITELAATRAVAEVPPPDLPPQAEGGKLPPALQAMVEERRRAHAEAIEAARDAAIVRLRPEAWRDLLSRASSLGISLEAHDGGGRIRLTVPLEEAEAGASGAATGSGAPSEVARA